MCFGDKCERISIGSRLPRPNCQQKGDLFDPEGQKAEEKDKTGDREQRRRAKRTGERKKCYLTQRGKKRQRTLSG